MQRIQQSQQGVALGQAVPTINVHLPAAPMDIAQVHQLTENLLKLSGCPSCFSGRNFAFLHMNDVVVGPKLQLTEVPSFGLPGQ